MRLGWQLILFIFLTSFPLFSDEASKVYLGISVIEIPESVRAQVDLSENTGLMISHVFQNSPAQKEGLQQWDILKSVGNHIISSPQQLKGLLGKYQAGQTIKINFLRKGRDHNLSLILDDRSQVLQSILRERRFQGSSDEHERVKMSLNIDDLLSSNQDFLTNIISRFSWSFYSDSEYSMKLEEREGRHWLTVNSIKNDDLIWSGFIDKEEERKKLPKKVHQKMKCLLFFLEPGHHKKPLPKNLIFGDFNRGARLKFHISPEQMEKIKIETKIFEESTHQSNSSGSSETPKNTKEK